MSDPVRVMVKPVPKKRDGVYIHLGEDLYEILREVAALEERSMAAQVRFMIREELDDEWMP